MSPRKRRKATPDTILILAANPISQEPVRLDIEVREIQNGLRRAPEKFNIVQQWATRAEDLRRALLDHEPSYVHFCGHGAAQSGIVLENTFATAEALSGLFSLFAKTVKCVVLNACYSSVQAEAISQHVDFVIGMSGAIEDRAAIEFAVAFYDGIAAGKPVEFAFALGCNAIQLAGLPQHLMPVLHKCGTKPPEAPHQTQLKASQPWRHDWNGAPTVSLLLGRELIAELLRCWILEDLCRVVLIMGLGGIGKTDLVTCLARGGNKVARSPSILAQGMQTYYECVIWRSLLNAPPPNELLGDILSVLSNRRLLGPSSSQSQIEGIIACLQDRQCLLVLDNVEAILEPSVPSMSYRPGYEPYGVLFQQAATIDHRSCLLLTSREKPHTIAELEGARKRVRSLTLDGIGSAEARDLFGQIGTFVGTERDWDSIVSLYNGNPLALELAAHHVDQVFGGDLSTFLSKGRATFQDLKELLNWHLDRLSPEEIEVVNWLAIERQPVSFDQLAENLLSPASRDSLGSTIQALQRRIPLEKVGNRNFTLQPVLIEHVTERLVDRFATTLSMPPTSDGLRRHVVPVTHGDAASDIVNQYALAKATATENVRECQRRLILGPVLERLSAEGSLSLVNSHLMQRLQSWRSSSAGRPGYLAGNLLNLLSRADADLRDADLSRLRIRQASFDEVVLHGADFSYTDFRQCTFKYSFGSIFALCYSPDGERIAVGDDNGEIRLFEVASGTPVGHFGGHGDVISLVTFSPDGKLIASASYDHTIRLWDHDEGGQCVNVLLDHESWVYSLAFSPTGETLASASEDGTVRVWDVRSGQCERKIVESPGFLSCVAFSPDGKLLAYAGSQTTVTLLDTADFSPYMVLRGHSGTVRALAFSPDGGLLASGAEDGKINLWRLGEDEPEKTLHGHSDGIIALSFSPHDDLLASSSKDLTVRIWSTGRSECVGSLRASGGRVWAVMFHPSGRSLATGSEDSTVRVWDLETLECLNIMRGYGNRIWTLAMVAKRPELVSGSEDRLVRIWNFRTGEIMLELVGHASRVWAVASSVDGRWIASASDDLTVRLWERESGRSFALRGHNDWIRSVDISPNSEYLASGGEDGLLNVWSIADRRKLFSIDAGLGRVFSVAFCKGGTLIAVGGATGSVKLFSPPDGVMIAEVEGHQAAVTCICGDVGDYLASASEDGTVALWRLESLQREATLVVGSSVGCVSFCGHRLLTGSADGILRLWDTMRGAATAEVKAHEGPVLALSAEGESRIASAGGDAKIRLWKVDDHGGFGPSGVLRPPRPYEGMNITGAIGLAPAQREALLALGAIELPSLD